MNRGPLHTAQVLAGTVTDELRNTPKLATKLATKMTRKYVALDTPNRKWDL